MGQINFDDLEEFKYKYLISRSPFVRINSQFKILFNAPLVYSLAPHIFKEKNYAQISYSKKDKAMVFSFTEFKRDDCANYKMLRKDKEITTTAIFFFKYYEISLSHRALTYPPKIQEVNGLGEKLIIFLKDGEPTLHALSRDKKQKKHIQRK